MGSLVIDLMIKEDEEAEEDRGGHPKRARENDSREAETQNKKNKANARVVGNLPPIGRSKNGWDETETLALLRGVERCGVGRWKQIKEDPELKTYLSARSPENCKDRWRTISKTGREETMKTWGPFLKIQFPGWEFPIRFD
jgi:hypothetical protein